MTKVDNLLLPDSSLNMRFLARLITKIENNSQFAEELLSEIYQENNEALILGITGPPGAGKSTLIDNIVGKFREQGKKIAVVAIDPSSPFSGGAILGDRIRMSSHFMDPNVFIRSMGSRGYLGGVAPATVNVMNFLTAVGFDVVIIETVGAGQSDIDIMYLVDSVLLVLVPGLGDDIQALKAGIMEIADIFVVNKADKPGKEKLMAEINMLLMLKQEQVDWIPPVLEVVATEGEGIDTLIAEIKRHKEYLTEHSFDVKIKKVERRIRRMIEEKIDERVHGSFKDNDRLNLWIEKAIDGKINPYSLIKDFDKKLTVLWEG
ncbi:MAG: methylmalonyl Co-A mutase-associated GTPase MeaB [Chloroflexota bacterium]